ncbi:RNA polymerase sigma factor [Plantactinospora siamensis]|uniref:RNA polymerase sigma factor n=1 Tax=Plantactinospora siamensis TaxID=555372 RepID=A0ABV6NWA5_9ACTN
MIQRRDAPTDRFTDLFDAHYGEIYRYVAGRLSASHADDLAAETFLVAFRDRAKLRDAGQVRAWLYGIATNLVRRHQRDEERRYRALARVGAPAEPAENDHERIISRVAAGGIHRELAAALRDLKPADRDVLLLVALADLNYPEVAVALGIPEGTVASRLNRARKTVRAALGGVDPTRDISGVPR